MKEAGEMKAVNVQHIKTLVKMKNIPDTFITSTSIFTLTFTIGAFELQFVIVTTFG